MARLDDQIANLAALSAGQLRAEWRRLFKGQIMPGGLGRDLGVRALAWRLQEQTQGGLPSASRRELARLSKQMADTGEIDVSSALRLKPGTKLVRKWHGCTYQVLVLDEGFQFEDRHYRSLTPIAHKITGAAWSGPRFFGLTKTNDRPD